MDSQPDGQSAIRPRQTERQTNKQTNTGARERRETHGHTPVGKQRLSSNRELDNNATNKQTTKRTDTNTVKHTENQTIRKSRLDRYSTQGADTCTCSKQMDTNTHRVRQTNR